MGNNRIGVEDYSVLKIAMEASGFKPSMVLSGLSRGVDHLAVDYALEHRIYCKGYPADWKTYGRKAGMIRNREMAKNADGLLAIWDKKSKNTENMIKTAEKLGLKVYIHIIK